MKIALPPLKLATPLAIVGFALIGLGTSQAATFTWAGAGTDTAPTGGTWDLTSLNWTATAGSGTSAWTQTSPTPPALNSATFGGTDGTYAISVESGTTGFAATFLQFSNSGYTLSGTAAQTIQLGAGAGGTPSIRVAGGKSATIGSNVTVQSAFTQVIGGSSGQANPGGELIIENGGTLRQFGATNSTTTGLVGIGTKVTIKTGGAYTVDQNNASPANFILGSAASDNVELVVDGGVMTYAPTTASIFKVGGNSATAPVTPLTGTLTVNSGTFTMGGASGNTMTLGFVANDNGIVNLNGGTLAVMQITKGGGTGTFNFNGGTLVALTGTTTTLMTGLTAANVKEGGAIIDTNAEATITLAQALLHGGATSIDGGLVKSGTGTLVLTGSSTYTGATTVSAGTLSLSTGSINSSSELSVSTGATLDLGNAISLNNNITLALVTGASVHFSFTNATETIGILVINGSSFVPAGTYDVSTLNTLVGSTIFSGDATAMLNVSAVPEPGTVALLIMGGIAIQFARIRRRA